MPNGNESFSFVDFITAVPGGASTTGTILIPRGWYFINIYGTQAAVTTDPTFALSRFVSTDTSVSGPASPIPGGMWNDTALTTTVDLEIARTTIELVYQPISPNGSGQSPIYCPHGLIWTYTKVGGTAINLSLEALRVG